MSTRSLRQDTGSMTALIDRYKGVHGWLSNGEPSEVWLGSIRCATVEHGYNAAKSLDLDQRRWVAAAPTPFGSGNGDPEQWGAKRRGRELPILRPGWDDARPRPVKLAVMEFLLRQKFAIPTLGRRLLGTGDAELVEGNPWHDNFWGRCTAHARQEDCPKFNRAAYAAWGDNNLGRLHMQIRSELLVVYFGLMP